MSRELLLIPKEKYEMILKSKEEKDPRMTTTMQKEDVPSEIQRKEPSKTINVRKTTTPKRSQRGYGFIVKKQTNGPPPGFSKHSIHKTIQKKKKKSVQWFKL